MKTGKNIYDLQETALAAIDDLPLWSAPFGLRLLDVVQMRHRIRLLDIGSGLGFPLLELAQRLGSSCECHGIDPWKAANERARQKIAVWDLPNLKIHDGKAETLPFPDAHFDLITSNNGTNNVDDEVKVYREIKRVARPEAQIVLTMNLPGTMVEFYTVFKKVLSERGLRTELEAVDKHICDKRKSLSQIRALVESAGLTLNRVYKETFFLRYTDGTSMLSSRLIRMAFWQGWINALEPPDVEAIFGEVERELNRLAMQAGELRLTVPWVCLDIRNSLVDK